MTTYFVAGFSYLPFTNEKYHFWRTISWTDKDTPQQFLEGLLPELENNPNNFKNGQQGSVVITAFNKL